MKRARGARHVERWDTQNLSLDIKGRHYLKVQNTKWEILIGTSQQCLRIQLLCFRGRTSGPRQRDRPSKETRHRGQGEDVGSQHLHLEVALLAQYTWLIHQCLSKVLLSVEKCYFACLYVCWQCLKSIKTPWCNKVTLWKDLFSEIDEVFKKLQTLDRLNQIAK